MIDATSPHGKLILCLLGALAEFERSMILARTSGGRKRAMSRGVRFCRKHKLSPFQVREAIARREAGEPLTDIGRCEPLDFEALNNRFRGPDAH
jgi:DNA invertase Pin-like site-specific DNA recombinase